MEIDYGADERRGKRQKVAVACDRCRTKKVSQLGADDYDPST